MTLSNDLNALIDDLKSTHGSNLVSVVYYGSATKIAEPAKKDVRLLVALDGIAPEDLRKAHACTREWAKAGYPAPAYFTTEELSDGADVFPIEFNHMMRARKTLYGRDVLQGVEVTNDNLRHQIEFELRSKLLRLRREYIAASVSAEALAALMTESLPSFVSTFRALLLLKELEPPVARLDVIRAVSKEFGIDSAPFEKIFSIRENGMEGTFDEVRANELFASYLVEIQKAVEAADSVK